MTVIEYAPESDQILDFINDAIRSLQEAGEEPKYIIVGPGSYHTLRAAMATRFNRQAGAFETYQFIPIVLDPRRSDTVVVLPGPKACADGVQVVLP